MCGEYPNTPNIPGTYAPKNATTTYAFLVELKHILTIERLACLQENSYKKKFSVWEQFYDEL